MNKSVRLESLLRQMWQSRGPLAWLLWPVSVLMGILVRLRRAMYDWGWLEVVRLPVPVVVVGNVCVGGGGKSPTVITLARHWVRQGRHVVIVSRGYGRKDDAIRQVQPGDMASEVGDEPLMLAQKTGVPVFVGRDRVEAARAALQAYPQTELILADDGLQHLALARDVEVVVFSELGVGNGFLLPAGPLREPWPRQADLVLDTSTCRRLSGVAVSRTGAATPVAQFADQPVLAVAAIANPEGFFAMLRTAGFHRMQCLPLPDHHDYADWAVLSEGLDDKAVVFCTEKDAAKLWLHRPDAWAVPMELHPDAGFFQQMDALLAGKLR